jgi:putative toxin-antitoxin system antitoxin component (TIGR02293 family)
MSDTAIERLLGGSVIIGHAIRSEMDLYELSRSGLPKKALLSLIANLNISIRSMALLLNITERTIQRKKDTELLDVTTSEQLLQIAEVFSRGTEVFGSTEDFQTWVNSENKALGNKKPMEFLCSRFGAQMVLDILGRIEHGIVA